MNFCDYFLSIFQNTNCCKNNYYHSQQPSFGTIYTPEENKESSFDSSPSSIRPSGSFKLHLSNIENKPTLETNESQKIENILLTDDCIQSVDMDFNQIWDAVDNNDIKAVNNFLTSNDGSLEDYDGFTLLHRSVIAGHKEMTEQLIKKIDISTKDKTGRTPLHYACIKSNPDIIALLLQYSANPLEQDLFGKFPADYCSTSLDIKKLFHFVKSNSHTSLSLEQDASPKSDKSLRKFKSQNIEEYKNFNFNMGNTLQVGHQKVRRLTGPIDKSSNLKYLQDFVVIKVLGVSSFGVVYLVRNEKNNTDYAFKVIEKAKIRTQQESQMIYTEKKLLVLFNHPFIIPLIHSFQTKHKLVLATPFCSGGSLSDQLLQKGLMEISEIRLYASEIIDALEYIHDSGYIYRALTLKNILITNDGHVMLSNFQSAKGQISEEPIPISFYNKELFPETSLLEQGKELDFYMLGLVLFELATGTSYQQSLAEIKDMVFEEFLSSLLEPVNSQRRGDQQIEDIKNHDFFLGINWFQVKFSRQVMPKIADFDVLPQFTDLELSVNEEFTSEKPYPNWSFTYE